MANKFKISITPKELSHLLDCDASLISKLKSDGVITYDDSTYETIKKLLKHYRGKSGDIDLKAEKLQSEILINNEQLEILKIKKERLRGTLVEFDLIKSAFDDMSIVLRNTILDSDAEITRLARTASDIDSARAIVRRKLNDCLKKLSNLKAEDFDGVTQSELEDNKIVPLEKTNE